MDNALLLDFLDEETKFIGRLLRSYTNRMEFRNFLRMNFNEFVLNIQNFHSHSNIELDTKLIFDYYKKISAINGSRKSSSNTPNKLADSNSNFNSNLTLTQNTNNSTKNLQKTYFENEILGKAIKRSSIVTDVFFL
jgi:hypothetical protein